MAYSGSKRQHVEILRAANLPATPIVVDGFFGGGGLSLALREAYPAAGKTLIAGESFAPLRQLYQSTINLKSLADMTKYSFFKIGITKTWNSLRDSLQGKASPWLSDEAFLILNNLGYGNSMRHGKGRHNIQPCKSKIESLTKRDRMIDPIAVRPDVIFDRWHKAIKFTGGQDATFLGDPPYQKSSAIYPNQNWRACAVPPVEMAMKLHYGCIGVFNNYSSELDAEFQAVALQHGYSVQGNPTKWETCFKPGATPKGQEWFWLFLP